MLHLFKSKRSQKQHKKNLQQDKIAESFVNKCIRLQEVASKFLQVKFEKLSINTKRFITLVFCLISVGSCVYLTIRNFGSSPENFHSITAIRALQTIGQKEVVQPSIGIGKEQFKKIQQFRFYIDSLASDKSGKAILDSILKIRPGLIDSLTALETKHQLQKSK
jgi:hypothetical protein